MGRQRRRPERRHKRKHSIRRKPSMERQSEQHTTAEALAELTGSYRHRSQLDYARLLLRWLADFDESDYLTLVALLSEDLLEPEHHRRSALSFLLPEHDCRRLIVKVLHRLYSGFFGDRYWRSRNTEHFEWWPPARWGVIALDQPRALLFGLPSHGVPWPRSSKLPATLRCLGLADRPRAWDYVRSAGLLAGSNVLERLLDREPSLGGDNVIAFTPSLAGLERLLRELSPEFRATLGEDPRTCHRLSEEISAMPWFIWPCALLQERERLGLDSGFREPCRITNGLRVALLRELLEPQPRHSHWPFSEVGDVQPLRTGLLRALALIAQLRLFDCKVTQDRDRNNP